MRARRLRRESTNAERRLWAWLRGDRLGVRFRRQLVFDRRFVLDFYAPSLRLAIEVDGGQHAATTSSDAARTRHLAARGVTVLRFWNNEVMQNAEGVVQAIQATVGRLTTHASPPSPLPGGGGCASGEASPETPGRACRDRLWPRPAGHGSLSGTTKGRG